MSTIPPRLKRDEIVKIVTDYYEFLTRFYIADSKLKFPPPGGWPNITPEATKSFNKAPYVIDLMRHLPYISSEDAREMISNIHYKCDVIDYSVCTAEDFAKGDIKMGEMGVQYAFDEMEEEKKKSDQGRGDADTKSSEDDVSDTAVVEEEEAEDPDRPHHSDDDGLKFGEEDDDDDYYEEYKYEDDIRMTDMLALAVGYESGGVSLVIDVFNGTIHEDVIRYHLLDPVEISPFFASIKEEMKALRIVPIRGEMFEHVSDDEEDEASCRGESVEGEYDWHDGEMAQEYKKIYRKFGWPGEGYKKDEALAAVEALRQQREDYHNRLRDIKQEEEKKLVDSQR